MAGSCLTRPFFRALIPFSQQIVLWSTAGINPETGTPFVDRLGVVKCHSLIIKIANDRPFSDPEGHPVETAWSRYFVDIYRDPDYVGN